MRLFVPVLALGLLAGVQEASAQFSAQKDAQYIATNTRTKNTTNRRVQQILEKAGQDIYRLLD